MLTPKDRGSLSEALFAALRASGPEDELPSLPAAPDDPEDEQLSLWALYELHYRGFEDAHDALEWHPGLLAVRRELESRLEHRLRMRFEQSHLPVPRDGFDADKLFRYVESHSGRSLAAYVRRHADREQVLDLLRVRSVYHLKETDPSAWAVPRLPRASQAALVELMYDEYGGGRPDDVHSAMFARAMAACGLDDRYGAYLDEAPAEVLEQNNTMSLFGLHRRLAPAAVGHLAAFEMTSSLPSRRIAQGLARLGMPAEVVQYYTEHVEADAVHEQLAARGICAALVAADSSTSQDVYFGAFSCLDQEDRVAGALFDSWGVAS
jgi:heme oxygenase-like protein